MKLEEISSIINRIIEQRKKEAEELRKKLRDRQTQANLTTRAP